MPGRTISLLSLNLKLSWTTLSSYFLISYLSSWPFLTLAKSHATTYSPVDVTIAFSSWSGPILNLSRVSVSWSSPAIQKCEKTYRAGVNSTPRTMYVTCSARNCSRLGIGFAFAGKLRSKPSWPV